jgi:hypothetical protein
MKFIALLLLGFLLLGTVVADRFMHGRATAGYTTWILAGGGVALALFALGLRVAKGHRTFLGFSRWQWAAFPLASFGAGVGARIYML